MKSATCLYILEGPDDVGKTTLALALIERLQSSPGGCEYHSFPGRDEGTLGHFVYDLHHRVDAQEVAIEPTALQLLHVAAHIDVIERRIRPALEQGVTVVLDRFHWSTWIYGNASGANTRSLAAMIEIEKAHWQEILPTSLFVIERDEPFGRAATTQWMQIAHAYSEASSRQLWGFPVHRIRNEGIIQDAVEQIIRHL